MVVPAGFAPDRLVRDMPAISAAAPVNARMLPATHVRLVFVGHADCQSINHGIPTLGEMIDVLVGPVQEPGAVDRLEIPPRPFAIDRDRSKSSNAVLEGPVLTELARGIRGDPRIRAGQREIEEQGAINRKIRSASSSIQRR